jgi:hypothetical protein
MRYTILIIAALLSIGCDISPSPEDAKLKTGLVGSWYYEYKNSNESMVKGVLTHADSGVFSVREKIFRQGNPPEEKSAGTWHITSGLFKLLTTEIEGKKLVPQEYRYFTCKVTSVSVSEFSCRDEVANQSYSYKKVSGDFKLS